MTKKCINQYAEGKSYRFTDGRSQGNKRDAKKIHMYANEHAYESHGIFGIFFLFNDFFLLFSSLMFSLEMLRQKFQKMFLIGEDSFYTYNYSNPHPKTYKPKGQPCVLMP